MAWNECVSAKGNLDTYHLERSAGDLDKVGLMRFEAQDDVPQSLDPCQGNGLDSFTSPQTLFQAPYAVPLSDNDPFMDDSCMPPPQPSSFIPALPAMEQGIHLHIPLEACGNHSATLAGVETQERSPNANRSGGTSVYSTWSAEAPGNHFDPERGFMTLPVHQRSSSQSQLPAQVDQHTSAASPVAGAEEGQRLKAWCSTCDKGYHAFKALTRHNDDCHSPPRVCEYLNCGFTCIGARKLQAHLEHLHKHPPPPRRRARSLAKLRRKAQNDACSPSMLPRRAFQVHAHVLLPTEFAIPTNYILPSTSQLRPVRRT